MNMTEKFFLKAIGKILLCYLDVYEMLFQVKSTGTLYNTISLSFNDFMSIIFQTNAD